MRRYQKALQFVEKVNDEAHPGNNAAEKGGLSITHFDSALLLESQKHSALLFMKTAAICTKKNKKEKKTGPLFSLRAFCFYASLLLEKLKTVHIKVSPAEETTIKMFLSAQLPQTKTPSSSVKAVFFSTLTVASSSP